MRRLSVLLGIAAVSLGCSGSPDVPGTPSEDPVKNEGVLYLEKPLDYWVGQATSADRQEELDKVVEALTLAMNKEDLSGMVTAADALQVIGPEAQPAAPALASKLDHVQPWVRCAAMDALAAIGGDAVPALIETVESGPGNAPVRAAITLGNIGPDAVDAIPTLEKFIEDSPNHRDRVAAIVALIDPSRADSGAASPPAADTVTVVVPEGPIVPVAGKGDWPQFHGPGRDSLCAETGLLQEWPEKGPKLLWQLEGLGRGYSTVSIAAGKIFTMGDREENREKLQFVIAFDLETRDELWATPIGGPHSNGPRCTPTVDGRSVYAIGTDGVLMCLEADTGNVRWQKSLPDDFDGQMMSGWKYSESPLVDGDRLVCTPGGAEATIVALDKQTGELIWKCALPDIGPEGKDGAAYSSIVPAEIDGVRQYVQLLGRGVVGVEADTGRFLWGYNRIANTTANISTPVVRGNLVFVSAVYRTGAALLQITRDGDAFTAREIYFLSPKQFENHHGGMVLVGKHIYGGCGQNRGHPTCLDLATGQIAWKEKALARGSASVVYADGRLIFRYDRGVVALIEATPEELRVKGSFQAPTGAGPAWSHPVIHDGKLYLRHDDVLLCYDLRGDG